MSIPLLDRLRTLRPRRASALAVLLVFLAASAGAGAAGGPPYEIDAVLPLTGSAAFLGTKEAEALRVLERVVNATGGIRGRQVRFAVADDQSSPQVAVQLTNAAIQRHATIILGSSVTATCSAMMPLVAKSGPLEYCFSPGVRGPAGSYYFATSAGVDSIAVSLGRFLRGHRWTRIAVITSTDASGQEFDHDLNEALVAPENKGLTVVAYEHFNPSDISVNAQIARIKAADPQALVTFTTGTALGTVLHAIHDSGLDVPTTASAGNMIYAQMAQYAAFAPRELYFAATLGVAPDEALASGPVRDAQTAYFRAFRQAGIRPDFADTLAWDPTMILIDGLRRLGPDASVAQLHDYVEHLHGWAGIAGVYDFTDGSQRGVGINSMIVYRWDREKNEFTVASLRGGAVR